MAEVREKLLLAKHFLIIDSPVPFTLLANNGTDSVYRMAGAWQIDTWKLLPEQYQKQYPVYELELVYDDTNLGNQNVVIRESNIDIGDGISGVNGQNVEVTNLSDIDLSDVATENTLQSILNYLPELKKKFSIKQYLQHQMNYIFNDGVIVKDDIGFVFISFDCSISSVNYNIQCSGFYMVEESSTNIFIKPVYSNGRGQNYIDVLRFVKAENSIQIVFYVNGQQYSRIQSNVNNFVARFLNIN